MNTSTSTDLDPDSNTQLVTLQTPRFGYLREDSSSGLAAHMLQEMYKMVTKWQQELQEIDHGISKITATGPILAAWLESRSFKSGATGESIPLPYTTVDVIGLTDVDPQAGYRLCGLDENGQLWARPCSMAEILSVSMAIARYQHLKVLTDRQQKIDGYIRRILEDLVHLRMDLQD
jgi:hypothetical protein